jgi:hypothetical protein
MQQATQNEEFPFMLSYPSILLLAAICQRLVVI